MKLIIIIMTTFLLQVNAASFAQKITYSKKNVSLEEVFKVIRVQTGYHVIYSDDKIDDGEIIDVDFDHTDIKSALEEISKNKPFVFAIMDKNIILKKKQPTILDRVMNAFVSIDLLGKITDENNVPLVGATVKARSNGRIVKTNENGEFYLHNVDERETLTISFIGFKPVELGIRKNSQGFTFYAIDKASIKDLQVTQGEKIGLQLRLRSDVKELNETVVRLEKKPTVNIEMEHRRHQNLGQLLEGSVPGLTLKSSITTQTDITRDGVSLLEMYNRLVPEGSAARTLYPTYESYKDYYYNQMNAAVVPGGSTIPTWRLTNTSTTVNNGIVPELRGSNLLAGARTGMLVVIDGFVQDDFPANYPMNNVESVEVIRDPNETIKWGPKAAGGVIVITTNGAKSNKLVINYSSNISFAQQPSNSNETMQLASTANVLDYYKEAYDKKLLNFLQANDLTNLTLAQRMLYALSKGTMSQTAFQSKWDSLSVISNREQLRMLQQPTFYQNHSISLGGGTGNYRFNLNGTYGSSRATAIKSHGQDLVLNTKNQLQLLKGRLRMQADVNLTRSRQYTASGPSGNTVDPYQLILNDQGGYLYNYFEVSPEQNNTMSNLGYYNYGSNALEDMRNSNNVNKIFGLNSRLNVEWDLVKDLQWATSLVYNPRTIANEDLQGMNTSVARKLANDYGLVRTDNFGTAIDFYAPPGDIFKQTNSKLLTYTARTGLIYSHTFGTKHVLNGGLSTGISSEENTLDPAITTYGYNSYTGTGLPFLPASAAGFTNYLGRIVYPNTLLLPGLGSQTNTRSIFANGNLSYVYNGRYALTANYGVIYMPVVIGSTEDYSTLDNYAASASWLLSKEPFFKFSWINTAKLSASVDRLQLSKLPPRLSSTRALQSDWANNAITISSYEPGQLNGQLIINAGAQLLLGMVDESVQLNVKYNHPSIGSNQLSGSIGWDLLKKPLFKIPAISTLKLDASIADINAYQGLQLMMSTNIPRSGAGYSIINNTNFEILPSGQISKEVHAALGFAKDRVMIDLRYYHNIASGLGYGSLPTDPATGLSTQLNYSKILNTGLEVFLMGKIIDQKFACTMSINGAYNVNKALDIPTTAFSADRSYLTTYRANYATDNLWSYEWLGLDATGNPKSTLVNAPVVYSGRTRAPITGAFIQDFSFKGFFASARFILNLGHVMRRYIPVASSQMDYNYLIADRWRKPGDEAFTDVPVMAATNTTKTLLVQNSTNSILPADNIRLREVQVGYEVPNRFLKNTRIKGLTCALQLQNVAMWTKNKYGIDPQTVSATGIVGAPIPMQYVFSLNMNF